VLAACGSAAARPPPPTTTTSTTVAPVERVLVVGDSLARELFLPIEYALEGGGPVQVDFVSVPSIPREPDLEAVWHDGLSRHRPDAVVVLVGYWEAAVMNGTLPTPDDYEADVLAPFAADAAEGGARLIWVGAPTVPEASVAAVLAVLNQRLAAFAGADFVDADALVSAPGGAFAEVVDGERVRWPDGLHLCPGGTARIAAEVFDRLDAPVAADWASGPWRTGLFSGVEVCGPT
jgi:hypothetical protein